MALFHKHLSMVKAYIIWWILCRVCRACDDRPACKCVTYSFHHDNLNWNQSREQCQKDNGDLVSMETDEEWEYLKEFIQNLTGSKHIEYFIGLSNKTGSWRWLSDSSEVTGQYSGWRWHDGQPSGDGECVVMYKNYTTWNNDKRKGYYNDLRCDSHGANKGFICENTLDCRCQNQGKLDDKFPTASPSAHVDGDATSPSHEYKYKFILVIVVGSLDVVLFIVTLILCRGTIRRCRRRNQPARK